MRRINLESDISNVSVAILAGGLATRLHPITQHIPKSLVPIATRPFLHYQLEYLREQGIRRVVLCVGHLGEQIQERFGDGHNLGLTIDYSFDGPRLLGTGGAICQALPLLSDDFFVLYGDSWLPVDYPDIYRAFRALQKPALMTVYENHDAGDASNVWFENGQIRLYDKARRVAQMKHIDYGVSVLSADVFEGQPRGVWCDLADLCSELSRQQKLAAFQVYKRFYEIGSHSGRSELDELFSAGLSSLDSGSAAAEISKL